MKEFWLWVVIVTLIIICIMGLSFVVLQSQKQIKQNEALLVRIEERERKQKLLTPKEE
jgi:hypothetical protein